MTRHFGWGTALVLLLSLGCSSAPPPAAARLRDGGVSQAPTPPMVAVDQPYTGDAWVPAAGEFVLRDVETGSLWNLRGEAFEGPMAEAKARLRQSPAAVSFWFGWSIFNTQTMIWTQDGVEIQDDVVPIEPDAACDVPCAEIVGGGPPKDGIPSVDFDEALGTLTMVEADDPGAAYLEDADRVVGVALLNDDGSFEARAYSHNMLWWHEIANDSHNGRRFTISFCPLTGSPILFDSGAMDLSFGTSGRLYNSNLVMYDRVTDSQWSQLLGAAITGPARGDRLTILPMVQTTWGRWKTMWPQTKINTLETGFSRDYSRYPYFSGGRDYRENNDTTFRPTRPPFSTRYPAKERVLGLRTATASLAFPFSELAESGPRVALNEDFDGEPLLVVFEAATELAIPFSRTVAGQVLSFEVVEAP